MNLDLYLGSIVDFLCSLIQLSAEKLTIKQQTHSTKPPPQQHLSRFQILWFSVDLLVLFEQ